MFDRAVVVMGKLPRAGRVKTRMAPPLTGKQCAALYRAFLADVFDVVDAAATERPARRVFCCALGPGEDLGAARRLAPLGWAVTDQSGGDLGHRIEAARAAGEARDVVVIGSDAPTMDPQRIVGAFDVLTAHRGSRPAAVVGPTHDGGYDLIGFSCRLTALLHDIPWSTEAVMARTRQAAADRGIRLLELGPGYDIDRIEDLPRALVDARRSGRRRTVAAIEAALASTESSQ